MGEAPLFATRSSGVSKEVRTKATRRGSKAIFARDRSVVAEESRHHPGNEKENPHFSTPLRSSRHRLLLLMMKNRWVRLHHMITMSDRMRVKSVVGVAVRWALRCLTVVRWCWVILFHFVHTTASLAPHGLTLSLGSQTHRCPEPVTEQNFKGTVVLKDAASNNKDSPTVRVPPR